jgi:hypothetical protein
VELRTKRRVSGFLVGLGVIGFGAVGLAAAHRASITSHPSSHRPSLVAATFVALVAAGIGGGIGLVLARRAGRDWFVGDMIDAEPQAGLGATAAPTAGQATRYRATPGSPADATRIDAAELAKLASTASAPPPGLSPAHGSVVLDEGLIGDASAAWVIEQSTVGTVTFDRGPHTTTREVGRATLGWTTTSESLVRTADPAATLPPVLVEAFGDRTSIPLGRYDPAFGAAWKQLRIELLGWRKVSGLWDPASSGRKTAATTFGMVGVLAGVIGVWLGASGGPVGVVALAALVGGLGLAGLGGGWELLVRTPAGSATWLHVESFRRFLHDAEGHEVDRVAEQGRLCEYTAWAVALGEIDRWQRVMALSPAAPRKDPSDHATASAYSAFAAAIHVAATSPTAPPSTT